MNNSRRNNIFSINPYAYLYFSLLNGDIKYNLCTNFQLKKGHCSFLASSDMLIYFKAKIMNLLILTLENIIW